MNTKILITLIVVVVAVGVVWLVSAPEPVNNVPAGNETETMVEDSMSDTDELIDANNGMMEENIERPADAMDEDEMSDTDEVMTDDEMMAEVKTFDLTAKNFEFSVTEIRVKQGDKVRINFINESGFHDWTIDEFDAQTKQLQAGENDSIEFVADQAGTFEFYCSVGQHRQLGMVGTLIVE